MDLFFTREVLFFLVLDLTALAGFFCPAEAPSDVFDLSALAAGNFWMAEADLMFREAWSTFVAFALRGAGLDFRSDLERLLRREDFSTFGVTRPGGSITPKVNCSISGACGFSGSSGTSSSFSAIVFSPSTARGTAQGTLTPSTW